MHFKFILLISCCLILSLSSARESNGREDFNREATNFNRLAISSEYSNPFIGGSGIQPPPPLPSTDWRGNPPQQGTGIQRPPPLGFVNPRGSGVTPPPSTRLQHVPTNGNIPQNVPKRGSATPDQFYHRIEPKRHTTNTNENSLNSPNPQNPDRNLSNPPNYVGGYNTAKDNFSKLSPSEPLPSWDMTGKALGRNVSGNAKPNGNIKGVSHFLPGHNIEQNLTLNSNRRTGFNHSQLANHTRLNNTRNAAGTGFLAGKSEIHPIKTSPIAKFPWDGENTSNPHQTANNNMAQFDNPPQRYDNNNGNAPRIPRNNVFDGFTKTVSNNAASKPNANQNSDVTSKTWNTNRSVLKSSVNNKSPSVILIAVSVILYFCKGK